MKKIILIIIEIILISILIYSGYKVITWYTDNQKTSTQLKEISTQIVVDDENTFTEGFKFLNEKNADTVAFLHVNGTAIDYPVVQTNNNDYYLYHSYDKTDNSAGWIFADYRCKFDGSDKNIIIYGHNRRDGSMFGTLKNILNKEWYENEENKDITFITEKENTHYEVFSVYQIEQEDYYIQTSFTEQEFTKFIQTLKNRSIYNFNKDISENAPILTLSTCADDNNYRTILHAIKIN